MSFQIIDDATDITEPVSLADQKAYSRIDADYSADDNILGGMITACRQLLENWLNVGLANREIKLQWDGRQVNLPLSPNGDVSSVMDGDTELDPDKYTVSAYRDKSIFIRGLYPYGYDFFYFRGGDVEVTVTEGVCANKMYEVTYTTGYEYDKLPKALKEALMDQVDWSFKNIGDPQQYAICPMAITLAYGYNKNTVLQ